MSDEEKRERRKQKRRQNKRDVFRLLPAAFYSFISYPC